MELTTIIENGNYVATLTDSPYGKRYKTIRVWNDNDCYVNHFALSVYDMHKKSKDKLERILGRQLDAMLIDGKLYTIGSIWSHSEELHNSIAKYGEYIGVHEQYVVLTPIEQTLSYRFEHRLKTKTKTLRLGKTDAISFARYILTHSSECGTREHRKYHLVRLRQKDLDRPEIREIVERQGYTVDELKSKMYCNENWVFIQSNYSWMIGSNWMNESREYGDILVMSSSTSGVNDDEIKRYNDMLIKQYGTRNDNPVLEIVDKPYKIDMEELELC